MDRIDALRLLLDLAQEGSFSAVARRHSLATSTVTLAVTQLESQFGARLVTRSTRKLVFTHEGERLLEDGRRIVSQWDAALAGVREEGPLSGPIRITATNDFGRTQLRPLLDSFQALHPGTAISLVLSDSTVDLMESRVDIALRNGPLPDSRLQARLLVRGERVVCAAPGYWSREGMPLHPDDLASHNCLILARASEPLTSWPFRIDGRSVRIKVAGDRQANDGGVLREWALAGHGVIIKNRWDIRREIHAGQLVTALGDYVDGSVDLYAVLPDAMPSRRVVALVSYLASAFPG